MAKDPRYKSGEHHYPEDEDSTKDSLEQLSTIGAVGAEIRSVRREMKLQFQHFGARFDDALNSIRDVTGAHQAMSNEHAGHMVRIKGLENRVKTLEEEERSGKGGSSGSHSGTSWMKIAAKNPAIPWAVACLLALAMILASITGRGISSIVPSFKDPPPPAATINVNAKE